jgi:hypothetical protein
LSLYPANPVSDALGHPQPFDHAAHAAFQHNTLRQRGSRLVREALSFSKQLANHIRAIKLFMCYDDLTKAPALHG